MSEWIQLVGPNQTVEIAGIKLVGVNAENGAKFLVSIILVIFVLLVGRLIGGVTSFLSKDQRHERLEFWIRQCSRLFTAVLLVILLISIWFDDPVRLATALGLVTAGMAFALQKVVTAVAGYFVILRGKTFNVGDRIFMGGVRGDVVALDFIKTTIMEMGQPPPVQNDEPAMWVKSRQYTGRIVAVSNAAIFDEPVYNYSREFPYLWEEVQLPIPYSADRVLAERILLEAAEQHTKSVQDLGADALCELRRRYFMRTSDVKPRVYYRLTDNWLELTVRFIAQDHSVRELKDALSRHILNALNEAGIPIASATFAVVGLPPVQISSPPLESNAEA